MDLQATTPLHHWMLTLTSSTGFDDSQEDAVIQWHKRKSEMCLLVRELHDDGRRHYHSLIACSKPKNQPGVVRALETLYKQLNLDFVPHVSVKVKKMTDKIGAFYYLIKDLKNDDRPLYTYGWRFTWIKEQCLANLKKMPHRMLCTDTVQLTKRTSTRMVIEYAHRSGMPLTGKLSFANVIACMAEDKYQFEGTNMKYLYAQVLAQSGHQSAMRNLVLNELHFLDDLD